MMRFYGGEPLVNFETVKYTVEYISKKYPYKEFSFFMTTNATLFSPCNITKSTIKFFDIFI